MNRTRDILQMQRPKIGDRHIDFRTDQLAQRSRNENPAGRCLLFKAYRNVNSRPIHVIEIENGIADIQSHPEANFSFKNFRSLERVNFMLELDGATKGIEATVESRQEPVTSVLNDLTTIRNHARIDSFDTYCPESDVG